MQGFIWMCLCPHRYSAAAADPPQGCPDRCSGVPHQCRVCQTARTSRRSGKRRYLSTSLKCPNNVLTVLLDPPAWQVFLITWTLLEDEQIRAAGKKATGTHNGKRKFDNEQWWELTSGCICPSVRKLVCSCVEALHLACHSVLCCLYSRLTEAERHLTHCSFKFPWLLLINEQWRRFCHSWAQVYSLTSLQVFTTEEKRNRSSWFFVFCF